MSVLHSFILVFFCCAARATLEILIPDFVKQTSEEKPVEGDELEVRRHYTLFITLYDTGSVCLLMQRK